MEKKLLVSDISNKIYLANAKPIKGLDRVFETVGEKKDFTDEAIRAVFEWFMKKHKENEPNEAYQIKFSDCPYVLQMYKEKGVDNGRSD